MNEPDGHSELAKVAELAYQKWARRYERPDEAQLRDWLEAEAELRRIEALSRHLEESQVRLSATIAAREHAERRLTVEHAVATVLAGCADLADCAAKLLRTIAEGLGWDAGGLWIVDRDLGALRCLEWWHTPGLDVGKFEALTRQILYTPGIGLPGRVWAADGPVWLDNIAAVPGLPRAEVALAVGLRGAYGFPVRDGAEFLGVLEFLSREVRPLDEELQQTMVTIGCQVSQFIERRHAEAELGRREEERRLARRIQEGLLPRSIPAIPGFAVGGTMRPADSVCGDSFGLFPLPEGGLDILIADASGHGYAAAMLVARLHAYVEALTLTDVDVEAILPLANRCLGGGLPEEFFVTALLLRLDPHTRRLTYAGAGHWPGYVLGPGGDVRATLMSTCAPLGTIDSIPGCPGSAAIVLKPGELVVLMTDGIPEAGVKTGAPFGVDRALDVVRAHRHRDPDAILDALIGAVLDYCGPSGPSDDLTAVVIQVD